jgi:hypothetical protein
MTSNIPDPFTGDSPVEDPEASEAFFGALLRASFLWDNRNCIPGAWMAFGGKRPEPPRNDPFKLVGQWTLLADTLWTIKPKERHWWAAHAHPAIRRAVATHETSPADLLDRLALDSWPEIRQSALGNPAVDPATRLRATESETVDWLREAVGRPEDKAAILGRCVLCGGQIRRPDRFLTCRIDCSAMQATLRLADGTYVRHRRGFWPPEYLWSVAHGGTAGGIPGTGPKFRDVRISFVPGLNAVDAVEAVDGLCELEDLEPEQAISAIDRMAQTMGGPAILEACRIDTT